MKAAYIYIVIGIALSGLIGCGEKTQPPPSQIWKVSKGYTPGNLVIPGVLIASARSNGSFADFLHIDRTPELQIRCSPRLQPMVFLDLGSPPQMELGKGADATVSYAIDGAAFSAIAARRVTDQRFAMPDPSLARRLMGGGALVVRFTPMDRKAVEMSFSLSGLPEALRAAGPGCFDRQLSAALH